jgi:hypothetical protein
MALGERDLVRPRPPLKYGLDYSEYMRRIVTVPSESSGNISQVKFYIT